MKLEDWERLVESGRIFPAAVAEALAEMAQRADIEAKPEEFQVSVLIGCERRLIAYTNVQAEQTVLMLRAAMETIDRIRSTQH